MKNKFIRITAILSAVLLILVALASCGERGNGGDTTKAPDVSIPASTEDNLDELGYLKDDLPEELNYDTTVNVLAWKDVEHEEFEAEENGDIVNDAIFKRNANVESRLGVTINYIRVDGDSDFRTSWNNYVGNSVKVTEREFDIVAGYSLAVTLNASSGYLHDMLDPECEYLNFEQPWWSQLLLDQATMKGKLFFASGDISRNALEMMYVCYVNTDILEERSLENPQNFVGGGDWTYEKFIEMCQGVYQDLDNSGSKTCTSTSGDRFGYVTSGIHTDPWFYGSGALICEKDADDNIIPSESFGGERVINTISMLNTLLYTSEDGMYTDSVAHQRAFGEGRLLFMMDRARVSHKVLAADYGETNFSILPCPKYDKDQTNYVTVMGNPFTLYGIAGDASDVSMCSAFIECFASEGYRVVTPAVFEISLKLRYVDDPVSAQMYDIIRENLSYDLGRLFSSDLIGQGTFRSAISGNSSAWGSTTSAVTKALKRACDKLTAALSGS